MQAAPAVTVSAGRSGAALVAYALLGALAVTCCAVWAAHRADLAGGMAVLAVFCLVAASLAAWAREPVCRLQWDGRHWFLASDLPGQAPTAGDVAVAIDLDKWLLLRFRGNGTARAPTRWLALQHADHAGDWHALRCAVYSPRPAERQADTELPRDV